MTQILDLCQPIGSKGISLIEASAGTGKTYSISNIFLHFILKGHKVDEILVVTFTEDATKELNERVRANLSDALACLGESDELSDLSKILSLYNQDESHQRIEHALANFDQASIFTIHSFCQRMLKENAFESHCLFDMELLKDDSAMINEVIEDFIRLKTYTSSALLDLKIKEFKNFQRAIEKVSELPTCDLSSEKIITELELLRSSENKLQEQREDFLEPLMQVRSEALKQVYQMGFEDELRDLLADQKGKKYQEEMDKSLSGLKDGLAKFPNSYKMKVQVFASSKLKGQTHELFAQCQTLIDAYADIKQFDEELKDLRGKIQESNNNLIRVLKVEFAEYFHASYQEKKDQINVLTFNDLIEKLHDALEQEASDGPLHSIIRKKFKVALVDEFQDTDPQQYKIFKSLFGDALHSQEHAFYMIGDPKQSIYRFRGADIFAYLQAKKDAQYSFTLKDNYRSETGMVDAVNHFFDSKGEQEAFAFAPTEEKPGICFEAVNAKANKSPFISSGSQASLQLQWIQPNEEDPQAELKSSDMEKLVPNIVAQEIVNLLNDSSKGNAYFKDGDQSKALQAGDIAILVNKHRQARSIQEVLIAAKVPAIIAKSGNIFDSDEALSIEAFLSAIFEPKDQKLTPLLLSNFFHFSAKEIKALTEQERFDYLLEFKEYSKEWERYGFLRCLQMFMDKHQIYTRSLSQEQGERKVSNLFQIREILHEQEKAKGLGISGLLRFLKEKIESTDKDDEQYLERLETDEEAVKIMTIHKSKGLEFPVVFCPYMWTEKFMEGGIYGESVPKGDFTYHDDERGTLLSLDPDGAHRDAQRRSWRRETLGEQLRLLYVALTRSANRCYLYWGNIENHKKNKNGAITKNSLFPSVFEFLANKNQSGQGIQENDPLPMDLSARRKFWQEELAGNNSATTFNEIYPVHHLASCKYTSHTLDTLIEPPSLQLQFPLWMDGSYSALIRSHEKVQFTPDEGPKDDESESSSMSDEDEIISGFFAFPRGAMPGTCIHEIFEFIDFQDESKWEEVISEKLSKYNLHGLNRPDHEKFLKARIRDCKEMLRAVLSTNLKGSDFALKDISKHQRMDELSFHYPVKDIQLKKLQALFAKHYPTGEKLAYVQDLDKLNYRMDEGYFNGSIDLTFQHEGKFYIVDWKSNYLGSQANQYHEKQLNKAVREHFYFLQYHIYSLALHLYLESHLHDYHYEKHFGSCIYAFIRGFEIGTDFGMHYDRVPLGLIEDMKQLFVHGEYAHV